MILVSDPGIPEQVRESLRHGFAGYCGLELQELSREKCVITVNLRPEHLNQYGFVHGGMIGTLLDNTGGIMAACAGETIRHVVTSCSDVFYLNPIRGDRMFAVATPVKTGHTMARIQINVFDGAGVLCAAGYAEYVYTDRI